MRWDAFASDIKYAARGLRRTPGFSAAVIVTLGLGIGANATMFSVVDELLFRPPAFLEAPDRIHRVYLARTSAREGERASSIISYKRYGQLSEWSTAVERAAGFAYREMPIGVGDATVTTELAGVSSSFFGLFDVQPVLGRFFLPDEDLPPEGSAVAVLSHGYWQSALGGTPDIPGRTLTIGTKQYTVIGVALALAAGRWLGPLLFDTSARDPVVFGVVCLTLVAVASLASAMPAWRAGRVDPNLALRAD